MGVSSRDRPPHPVRAVVLVLAAAAAVVLLRPALAALRGPDPAPEPGAGEVVRVVDGDTVVLRLGGEEEVVRLLGVDTPETLKPGAPVECWGPQAAAHTKALLAPGTEVRVARDVEVRDRYGRLLLYVWRERDELFVNEELVAGGWAQTLSIAPNTARAGELAAASSRARAEGRGLWSACPAAARNPP